MGRMFSVYCFAFAALLACKNEGVRSQPGGNNKKLQGKEEVSVWLTSPSDNILFSKQRLKLSFAASETTYPVIEIDTTQQFQTVDGFGNTLTGGSAIVMNRMGQPEKSALLNQLFSTNDDAIGISYLRISIGASDLNDRVFSYNDLAAGQTDTEMKYFSIAPDKTDLIPLLKEILAINPDIKIMGSPWSAPLWMKTNGKSVGGSLKPEYFGAYALYFVRYIKAMEAEGIKIDAITVQNEPLHDGNNPSMYMTAADQALFIKNHLGPAFRENGIKTKIVVYDHNADKPEYPAAIYNDAAASEYVDGAAFHLYGGNISALGELHNQYPSKNLYFTEQWIGAPGNLAGDLSWHLKNVIIGSMRNWSKCALEWNMASDPMWDPHTPGGCDRCLGTVTVDGNKVTKNPSWYVLAHCAKFVRPGSVRIASGLPQGFPNVAFKTPDGRKVLIVLNESGADSSVSLKFNGKYAHLYLTNGSAATLTW